MSINCPSGKWLPMDNGTIEFFFVMVVVMVQLIKCTMAHGKKKESDRHSLQHNGKSYH